MDMGKSEKGPDWKSGKGEEEIKALWALEEREKKTRAPAKLGQFVFRINLLARGC
jgi:hypothetical protein